MMNKRSLLSKTGKLVIFCFLILALYTCKNTTGEIYFDEYGSLLWVDDEMQDSTIKRAVHETLEHSSLIVAQIPWAPKDTTFFNNIKWYRNLATDHGKAFMLNIDWLKNNRTGMRGDWGFENDETQRVFKEDIEKAIKTYKPDYLTLGIEVNYYALTDPEDYSQFVSLFNSLKEDLKDIHPKLKIGLSFQLELLYGDHIDWHEARTLETLDVLVENLDYLGLSTYPDFSRNNNIDSSLALIDSVSNSYDIQLGILETGISDSTNSRYQREEYIRETFQKFHKLDLKFIIWGSMIDGAKTSSWANRFGLLSSNGKPKPEFKVWQTEIEKIRN